MRINTRPAIVAVAFGLLAAGGARVVGAQQPSASTTDTGTVSQQKDTAVAAKPSKSHKATKKGAHGYRHTGAPADTALRAKPGTQTGPSRSDSDRSRPSDTMTQPSGQTSQDTSLSADKSSGVETGRVVPADTSTYTPPRSDSGMYAPPDSAPYAPPRSDSGTYAPPDSATYAPPTSTTTTPPPAGTTPVQPPNSSSQPPEG
jgi:hypothetical protein